MKKEKKQNKAFIKEGIVPVEVSVPKKTVKKKQNLKRRKDDHFIGQMQKQIQKTFWQLLNERIRIFLSPSKDERASTTTKVLWIGLFFTMGIIIYDTAHPARVENGLLITAVSNSAWNFLEIFFLGILSLYGVRKGTDALAWYRTGKNSETAPIQSTPTTETNVYVGHEGQFDENGMPILRQK